MPIFDNDLEKRIEFTKNVRYRHETHGAIVNNGHIWSEVNIEGSNCLDYINEGILLRELIDKYKNKEKILSFVDNLIRKKIISISDSEASKINCRIGIDRDVLSSIPNIHRLIAPLKLGIEITGNCNYYCKYCSAHSYKRENLDFNIIKSIHNQCKANGIFSITLSGGEPFIHPNIEEIISLFLENNSPKLLPITSNGSIYLQKKIGFLTKIGVKRIQISMLSMDPNRYEFLSGGEKQNVVLKSIELLQNSGIEVILCHTVLKNSFEEIRMLANFCQKKSIKFLHLMTLMSIGRATSHKWKFSISDYLQFYKKVIQVQEEFKDKLIIDFDTIFIPRNTNHLVDKKLTGCRAGQYELYILPNGDIIPCNTLSSWSKYIYGNIKNEDLLMVWRNNKDLDLFRKRSISSKKNQLCNDCMFYNDCRGGCPAEDEISKNMSEHRCFLSDPKISIDLLGIRDEIYERELFKSWFV